jgi:hypothetical protein
LFYPKKAKIRREVKHDANKAKNKVDDQEFSEYLGNVVTGFQKSIYCLSENIHCRKVEKRNQVGFFVDSYIYQMNQDERCEAYKEWMQNFLFSFLHYPPIKEGTKDGSIGKAKRQAQ